MNFWITFSDSLGMPDDIKRDLSKHEEYVDDELDVEYYADITTNIATWDTEGGRVLVIKEEHENIDVSAWGGGERPKLRRNRELEYLRYEGQGGLSVGYSVDEIRKISSPSIVENPEKRQTEVSLTVYLKEKGAKLDIRKVFPWKED